MRASLFALAAALLASGCASAAAPARPLRTALETRAPQSRSFETTDRAAVLSAVMQGLQDAGFQVTEVDTATGFLSANAQHLEGREASTFMKTLFWYPYLIPFRGKLPKQTQVLVEVTATVVDERTHQRVRLAGRKRTLDKGGRLLGLVDLDEPAFYQGLFAGVDKALFLAREGF